MNRVYRKFLAVFAFIFSLNSFLSKAAADPIDEVLARYIYVATDIRYVEFLSLGHLHKNKPRYRKYNWKVIETPHFWLYVYDLNPDQEAFYIQAAEKKFDEFSNKTKTYSFSEKIRIAIFNSSRDFEESNLVSGIVPKGLGGQTEMIKWKRVLIAFRDSPMGFERLLAHELWHRYQGEFLKITLMNAWKRDTPLWFIEGSAEHFAHKWDARGELFMRDTYLHNKLAGVSDPYSWNTVGQIYKQGEYVMHFLAEEYKEKGEIISTILKASKEMKFEEAFQKITGEALEDFDKKLKKKIEKEYSPLRIKNDLAENLKSQTEGTLIAARDNFFITKKWAAGRERLILNWTNGTETKSKILAEDGWLKTVNLKGHSLELSSEFGYQMQGGSFVSSSTFVYTKDVGGKDALVFQNFSFDTKKKNFRLEEKETYPINELREVQYPVVMNDEGVAFIGRQNYFAELYSFNRKTGKSKKLTSAQRTYRGLSYSKKLNVLITSVENENTKSYDLAIYELDSERLSLLTQTPENEFSAVCSTDGSDVLYVSDRGLVHNLYLYDLEKNTRVKLTDAQVGFFHPQWFGENGIIFNRYNQGVLEVVAAPLPKKNLKKIEKDSALKKTKEDGEDWDSWKKLLPGSESLTIFEVAISSDKTKAVLLENRKLSMEKLGGNDPEIRFYLVDRSALNTVSISSFTLKEFRKIKDFGQVMILHGNNILLQNSAVRIETVRDYADGKNGEYKELQIQEGVVLKDSYIYESEERKIYEVDNEISSNLLGRGRFLVKLSPRRDYVLWTDKNRNKVWLYSVRKKEKRALKKNFYEIQGINFTANDEILVLDKKWNLSLTRINLTSEKEQTWEKLLPDNLTSWDKFEWFPISSGTKVFFLISKKETGGSLDVFLFNTETSSLSVIQSGLPLLKKSELDGDKLRLTLKNDFGLKRTLLMDGLGNVILENESLNYSVSLSSINQPSLIPLEKRPLEFYKEIPTKTRELYKLPRVLHAYGAAAVTVGSGGVGAFIALEALAFDELNNKAVFGTIYLQNVNQGFADIHYYNFDKGRSYFLNYWNVSNIWQKLDVGASKNIFLHEYLNWDVTLKQQQVRNERNARIVNWSRAKIATSFSVDTIVWDCEVNDWRCHGPYSGATLFTELESGIDYKLGYQATDLNLDGRYYLPITDRSGLAMRLATGKSFGAYPSIYVWGGNKTFRGIPLFSQAGNSYILQSTDLRFPIMDYLGAIISGPVGEAFAPLTMQVDIRGGLYNDIGDIWYMREPLFDGHRNFKLQQSAGYFINIPTAFGLNLRFSKGLYGQKGWNFWLGYNW